MGAMMSGDHSFRSVVKFPFGSDDLDKLEQLHPDLKHLAMACASRMPMVIGELNYEKRELDKVTVFNFGKPQEANGGVLEVDFLPVQLSDHTIDTTERNNMVYFGAMVRTMADIIFGEGYITWHGDIDNDYSVINDFKRGGWHPLRFEIRPNARKGDFTFKRRRKFEVSARTKKNLKECVQEMQLLATTVLQYRPGVVIEGTRSFQRQQRLYDEGNSRARPGTTAAKHTFFKSFAMDFIPYVGDTNLWGIPARYQQIQGYTFAGTVKVFGDFIFGEGIIRMGADWNANWDTEDTNVPDPCHFEVGPIHKHPDWDFIREQSRLR